MPSYVRYILLSSTITLWRVWLWWSHTFVLQFAIGMHLLRCSEEFNSKTSAHPTGDAEGFCINKAIPVFPWNGLHTVATEMWMGTEPNAIYISAKWSVQTMWPWSMIQHMMHLGMYVYSNNIILYRCTAYMWVWIYTPLASTCIYTVAARVVLTPALVWCIQLAMMLD